MIKEKRTDTLGVKGWVLVWCLGLAGQICWNLENNFFANYLYQDLVENATIVTLMTIFSAAATTFSTFLFGTLSDRIGSRRPFVAFGYIAWGVFTVVYGLTHVYRAAILDRVALIGVIIVFTDTIMSFFGSAGNDSGFNAWCSDMLNDKNKGAMGATLAAQPVLGTLIGLGAGGIVVGLPIFTDNGKDPGAGYMWFFIIIGVLIMLFGLLALFTLNDSTKLHPVKNGTFWQQFASVFNFKRFFKMKELVWVNVCVTVFFIGFNCYFIHILNWLNITLGFSSGDAPLLMGIPLVLSVFLTLPIIPLINKNKSPLVALLSVISSVVGCLFIFFMVGDGDYGNIDKTNWLSLVNWPLYVGMLLIGFGYVAAIQTYMVWAKKLYPQENHGQFEGIRILFFVLFPMVAGPVIANPIIHSMKVVHGVVLTARNELPTKELFLAAAIITVLTLVPLYFANKYHNERIVREAQQQSIATEN